MQYTNTATMSEQSSAQHESKQVWKWLYIGFTLVPAGVHLSLKASSPDVQLI